MQYQSSDVDYHSNAIDSTIASLSDDAKTMAGDLQKYQQDAAALPDYSPAAVPDPAQVATLHTQAQQAVAGWKATEAGYQTKIKKLLDKANQIATAAQSKYCG